MQKATKRLVLAVATHPSTVKVCARSMRSVLCACSAARPSRARSACARSPTRCA